MVKQLPKSSETIKSEDPTLVDALRLLYRLNGLRDKSGNRLCSLVRTNGFEHWWFIQEQLFWLMLVPWFRHRDFFHRILKGEQVSGEEVPDDAKELLPLVVSELRTQISYRPPRQTWRAGWESTLRVVAGVVAQLLIAVLGVASLIAFRLRGKDTLLYAIDVISPGLDHDFRIGPVYDELRRRNYPFGEWLHAYYLGQAGQNLLRRGRPVVHFEVITSVIAALRSVWPGGPQSDVEPVIDPSSPDDVFLALVARTAIRSCRVSALETDVIGRLLRIQGVRRAVILDDSRHAHELVAACKALGIPTLGYMHGLFNPYHVGLMAYGFNDGRRHSFDLYGVWSDYFRQRLLAGDLHKKDNTFVSGPLRRPAKEELALALRARRQDPPVVRVLLVSEPRARQQDVRPYVQRLAADRRFIVCLRLRPGEDNSYFGGSDSPRAGMLEVSQSGSLFEAITQADVVLGTYSTVLYEAALAFRPSVVLNTRFAYGHDIVYDGLAGFAEHPDYVCEAVLKAASLPDDELIRRKEAIWGKEWPDGASYLFDVAEERLWDRPGD